jgi:hypothetical protein
MGAVMGQLLVSALGVAVSPLPIGATVVVLLAGDRRSTSLGLLVGWLTGIALVLVGAGSLGRIVAVERGGRSPALWALSLVVGVLAVAVAARTWRTRRAPGAEPRVPAWVATVGALPPSRTAAVGLLLAGANPKVLALVLPVGIGLAAAPLSAGEELLAGAAFVLLAGSTVLVPVALRLVAGHGADPALVAMRAVLIRHGAAISSVVLLVVGAVLVVQGGRELMAAVTPAG